MLNPQKGITVMVKKAGMASAEFSHSIFLMQLIIIIMHPIKRILSRLYRRL